MDLLILDKPRRMTSRKAAGRLVRALHGPRRAKWGFVGTLDPLATGLLPICTDWKTGLISYLEDVFATKTYLACFAFGCERHGDDLSGAPFASKSDVKLSIKRLSTLATQLSSLQTALETTRFQIPSTYSAKHVSGQRAYILARRGEVPFMSSSPVTVEKASHRRTHHVQRRVLSWWELSVSRGTYIRAFAKSIGQDAGVGGFLNYLNRTQVGPIHRDNLGWHETDCGLRYAKVSLVTLFHWLPTKDISTQYTRDIMTGISHNVHLPIDHRIEKSTVQNRPEVLCGPLVHNQKSFLWVMERGKSQGSQDADFQYKILKRIEISNRM